MDKETKWILQSKGDLEKYIGLYSEVNCSFALNQDCFINLYSKDNILLHIRMNYEATTININWIIAEEFFKMIYDKTLENNAEKIKAIHEVLMQMQDKGLTIDDLKGE